MKKRKNLICALLMLVLVLSSNVFVFANMPSDSELYDDFIFEINKIDDSEKKELIMNYVFTPIYISVDEGQAISGMDINTIIKLSQMTIPEIESLISIELTKIYQESKINDDVKIIGESFKLYNNLCPELNINIMDPNENIKYDSKEARAVPDRDYSKQSTKAYNSLLGTVAKFTLYVNWSVRNAKITSYGPLVSYVESPFYTYHSSRTVRSELTNANQFGLLEVEGTFENTSIVNYISVIIRAEFYTDGSCDFS